jgi:hypothetical protein
MNESNIPKPNNGDGRVVYVVVNSIYVTRLVDIRISVCGILIIEHRTGEIKRDLENKGSLAL